MLVFFVSTPVGRFLYLFEEDGVMAAAVQLVLEQEIVFLPELLVAFVPLLLQPFQITNVDIIGKRFVLLFIHLLSLNGVHAKG